jgi:MFS family permease
LWTVREPRRGNFDPPQPVGAPFAQHSFGEVARTIANIKPLLLLLLAAVSVVIAQAGLSAFMSPFLIRVHDLSVEEAGYAIALAKGPTGILGILAGGIIADKLARRSTSAAPRVVGFLIITAAPLAILGLLAGSWIVAILLFAAYNFFNYTYYGATFSTYMTLAPVRMRGALAAILAVALTMVGYGVGPTLAGASSDLLAVNGVADPLRWALVIIALFFIIAGSLFLAAAKSIRQMDGNR